MAERWKLFEPVCRAEAATNTLEEALEATALEDGEVKGLCFTGENIGLLEGKTLELSACRFERCSFVGLDFGRLSFVDCIFEKHENIA